MTHLLTSELSLRLGARYSMFGFSHDWQVVAALSQAGGCGVLGANRYDSETLRRDLARIEERVGDKPYGVNLLMPRPSNGPAGGVDLGDVPAGHREFLRRTCEEAGLMVGSHSTVVRPVGSGLMTLENAMGLWEVCREAAPRVVSIGLGVPPASVMDDARALGAACVGLAGSRRHAERLMSVGFDVVVAQGYEAAGHTGTIGGFVLVPDIVDAVSPLPVLAAGGIVDGRQVVAARALGAAGVWLGSALLVTTESSIPEVLKQKLVNAQADETYRTRALSGKPSRQLGNVLLDAWSREDAPSPLPSPLQGLLMRRAVAAGLESGDARLMVTPAGQGVGMLRRRESVAQLVERLVAECETTRAELSGDPCRP